MKQRRLKAEKKPKWFQTRLARVIAVVMVIVIILTSYLMLMSSTVRAVDDYTFDQETVNDGYSINPSNKNAEDGNYNELIESDMYPDTNFTASTENVVTGTGGGGAFPTALNTDDATRRSYTEVDTGGAGSVYYVYLMPNGDSSVQWDAVYPTSPTTHYDKVDEQGVNDGDTTYVYTSTGSDLDIFNMADMSEPAAGYDIDVTTFAVHKKAASQPNNFQAGIRIGTTNYIGINVGPTNGVWTNTSATVRTINPATSAEWTFAEVNALMTVITTSDASPDVYCTKIGIMITVTIPATTNYKLDVNIVYSSVTTTSQTTSFYVYCQGYRSGAENFLVYAWDYTGLSWTLKTTVQAASDTDYNFALISTERDGAANEAKFRFIGSAETGDTTQDILYLDVLKIKRIEQGYALDVDMSSTTVAQYGNITVRIKGYTSAEQFNVNVWNYTSSAYDTGKLAITDTGNAWQTTIDLCDDHHRSVNTVKIQFTDNTAYTADTTRDTLYLDVVWVTRYHTDPTITLFGSLPVLINEGETAYFWANYTDYDNEAPTLMDVHIDASDYGMSKNSTDVSYWNGVNYSYSTSALTNGNWTFYFNAQDANSGVVSSSSSVIAVNAIPTLTGKGVFPTSGGPDTYSFYVTYTDEDDNAPAWVRVTIDGAWFDMVGNATNDGDFTNGESYYYEKYMDTGSHPYVFWTQDYNSGNISTVSANLNIGTPPTITFYYVCPNNVTEGSSIVFFACYTDADNNAPLFFDLDIEGNNWNLLENNSGDVTYTDGKYYYLPNTNLTNGNYTCFFKTQDINSDPVNSGSFECVINALPVLSGDTVYPTSGNSGQTFQFQVVFTDDDGNMPSYIQVNVDLSDFSMVEVSPADTNTVDGKDYYYDKPLAGGSHDYYFKAADYLGVNVQTTGKNIYVNNPPTLGTFGRLPGDPCYIDTLVNFTCTFTDIDNDLPTSMKWREGGGAIQNVSMLQVDSLDVTTTDGKDYYVTMYLSHGVHNYDYYASDGTGIVSGGSNSITIQNRAPIISDQPTDPSTTYRNTYWEFDCAGSDPDGDSTGWEMSTNGTFLSINPSSGLIYGTTSDPVAGYYTVIWLNDSYAGSDSYSFWLWVVNRVPTISSSGNTTQAYNTYLYYAIAASDPDTDGLSYALSTNASWAGIVGNVVSGTASQFGWFNFDVWANDSYGGSAHQAWILTVGNTNPYFTSTPVYWGVNWTFYSYLAHAVDPESQPITYGLNSNASFLSVHPSMGYVNGTPDYVGSYWVNVSAFDGVNYAYANYSLGINNTAPIISTTPDLTGTVGVAYYYDCDASDANNDLLYYALATFPAWAGIDHLTGEVTGTPGANGNYLFKLTVTDSEGGMAWQNWTAVVTGGFVPPVTIPTDEPDYGTPFYARFTYWVRGLTVVVEDNSIGEIQRWQWTFGDGFGSQGTKVIHTFDRSGTYVITLTIIGMDGQRSSVQIEITVQDDPGWYIEKGEVGWIVGTPAGELNLNAVLCVIAGAIMLILSFMGERFKIIKPKLFKLIGALLFLLGAGFYAA